MFHVKHQTIKAAKGRLIRLFLFHGTWFPTTHEQPIGDNPRGAVRVPRETLRRA